MIKVDTWPRRLMLGLAGSALVAMGILAGSLATTTRRAVAEIRQVCTSQSDLGQEKHQHLEDRLGYAPYRGLMFVENQVVITGDQAAFWSIKDELGLSFGEGQGTAQAREERIGVYTFQPAKDSERVEQAICMINEYACEDGTGVCADPNYHLSPAGWRGGGSPWTQNGDWVIGIPGGGLGYALSSQFIAQWAFGDAGINLFDPLNVGIRTIKPTGDGVWIGVFDTSPFDDKGWEESADGSYRQRAFAWTDLMSGAGVPLTNGELIVWHYDLPVLTDCPGYSIKRSTGEKIEGETPGPDVILQDLSNHGLFVASLAHTVAPDSDIYLVRVLENDACGDLYSIAQGIQMFMAQAKAQGAKKVVLNLSLGVHQPPCPRCFGLPKEVIALQNAIDEAIATEGIEVTVVAAAGNDSYDKTPDAPEEMEIPAAYDNVIGVASSNEARNRGCFSNGDVLTDTNSVAAPGGDGVYRVKTVHVSGVDKDLRVPCAVPDCRIDKESDRCVIGLVNKPRLGYAYWAGTSFSAPLVSGLEALFLGADMSGVSTPSKTCLSLDATLPNGIIDMQESLGSGCSP